MNRIVRFLRARSFAILLFHAGMLLFSWPLLSLPSEAGGTSVFTYLIITWAAIVALLIVVGHSIKAGKESGGED